LVEAKAAEARQRQLLANGSTTHSNYDAALKNMRSAEGKLDSAKASLELASDQLTYCELRAEFDGVVTAVGAESGQVVSNGRMIVKLARAGDKDAVFAIAESVFDGQKPANERPEIVVTLLSDSSVTADGVIREISPVADPSTRTYQVKVTLKNAPEQMRFGASVVGQRSSAMTSVVTLPGSALFDRNGHPAVWVVDAPAGSLALRPVTVVRYETDRVIISDGVARGEIVVTAGVNRLRENQKVRLVDGSER
jgi:RND family efflux transporter MFP subunit